MNPITHTTAPGHQARSLTIDGHVYAAVAEPTSTANIETITVYRDGQPWDTRRTHRHYGFVNLQGWEDQDGLAARYSAKPLRVGARIEYGTCRGSLAIQRPAPGESAELYQPSPARPRFSDAEKAALQAQSAAIGAALLPGADDREQAPERTGSCQVCGQPSEGWTGATDASEATERCLGCAGETAGAFTAWPKGRAPATAAVAARHAGSTSAELELASAVAAKALADRRWRQAIVEASEAGLSARAIARAVGVTHPTVVQILAAEAAAR